MADGNIAALREALDAIYMDAQFICDNRDEAMLVEHRADHIERMVNAALAAPVRNCDRFSRGVDAVSAYYEKGGHPITVVGCDFADWLFATAGGDKK